MVDILFCGVDEMVGEKVVRGEEGKSIMDWTDDNQEYFLGDPKPVYPIPPNGFRPSKLASPASRKFLHLSPDDIDLT